MHPNFLFHFEVAVNLSTISFAFSICDRLLFDSLSTNRRETRVVWLILPITRNGKPSLPSFLRGYFITDLVRTGV